VQKRAAILFTSILGLVIGTVACEEDSTPAPANQTCTDGAVSCGEGASARCVNVRIDSTNCGSCGRTCSAGQTCTSGDCATPSTGTPDAGGGGGGGGGGDCKALQAPCEVSAECCSRVCVAVDGDFKVCRPG
jgi:hypothetical protein